MAAAEARAAWQRANRCFVQEDAKRAPKLASRQSSTSSSIQVDAGLVNAADHSDHPGLGFMPFNRTPSYSKLSPDAKWWLQMQPNYLYQRGFDNEYFSAKKGDGTASPQATVESHSQVGLGAMSEESLHNVKMEDLESFFDVKKHSESSLEELNLVDSKVDQDFLDVKNMTDYYELLEMEMVGGSVSKQSSNFSSSGGDKVPWWRVTDGEELASFVAQKSLYHIENCDLPPPQKMNVRREPCKQARSIDHDEIIMSSIEREAQSRVISSPSSVGSNRKMWSSIRGEVSQTENVATEPLRASNTDPLEQGSISVNDPDKAKLLEALCHSQTRAREAEKAAKQAYNEKEHVLKLFFRQASQLFAYKQWFKLLQLENLLLQSGNNCSSPLTAVPDLLPWMPPKPQTFRKRWQKSSKAKRRKRRGSDDNDIGKYAVAFAVGFTLVGAGLILGWTVGWLLPAF